MGAHKDLTGQIIGNWKICGVDHIDQHHNYLYKCECMLCHKFEVMRKYEIEKRKSGCGCQNELNLVGQKIGCWTVLYKADDVSDMAYPRKAWICQCCCGKLRRITETKLKNNTNPNYSCGCQRYLTNDIYIYDDHAEIILPNSSEKCLVDLNDMELIKNNHWDYSSDGYAISSHGTYKTKRMHRVIMDVINNPDVYVDHINRNKLDNRRVNLRLVTSQQNSFNQKLRVNNKSGVTGVIWWERDQNWAVQIKHNYVNHRLGYFDNFDDAVRVRLLAEIQYFGAEFAPQRHLFKEYGIDEKLYCVSPT